jgi:hypothetical protein
VYMTSTGASAVAFSDHAGCGMAGGRWRRRKPPNTGRACLTPNRSMSACCVARCHPGLLRRWVPSDNTSTLPAGQASTPSRQRLTGRMPAACRVVTRRGVNVDARIDVGQGARCMRHGRALSASPAASCHVASGGSGASGGRGEFHDARGHNTAGPAVRSGFGTAPALAPRAELPMRRSWCISGPYSRGMGSAGASFHFTRRWRLACTAARLPKSMNCPPVCCSQWSCRKPCCSGASAESGCRGGAGSARVGWPCQSLSVSWRSAQRAAWRGPSRPAGRNGQARKFHSDRHGSNAVHNGT